jgi:hypothetical protein
MLITKASIISGKRRTRDIPCTEEQLAAWRNGTPIQKAMPQVSADDREFILTGITPDEGDLEFKDDEPE